MYMSSLPNLPNLPNNIIKNIQTKRLNLISKNVYNSYQVNNNELYNVKPLGYLSKYFKEHAKLFTKEEKTYVRNKFRKYLIRDQLIQKILNVLTNMGNLSWIQRRQEMNKLEKNDAYFEDLANPKWLYDPPKKWVSLWKTYIYL